jgi:methyltransferase-like protein/trans-aconitate methyltransferase
VSTSAVVTGPTNKVYDDVPYESYPFPQSHPDRLATMATLFGMQPTPVSKCRVLELGCASGGNLIPVAYQYPKSKFVGVDLSAKQIETGQHMINEIGLKNIELKQMDIKAVDESFGKFDYIITHGIYSWVPDDVKEAIYSICQNNLAPNGVAYISYNVLPGWHFRGMIREMMLYHTAQFSEPNQKAQQARALIDFLVSAVPNDNTYGSMLKSEVEVIRPQKDYYLLHDHLEETNTPVYFHDFIERATNHGLQFLGEADFAVMVPGNFGPQVGETLSRISNEIVRTEQYMDFLRNRLFRQTLLCHSNVTLNRMLNPRSVMPFYVSSTAQPTNPDMNPATNQPETFVLPNQMTITAVNPLTKAALQYMHNIWPQAIEFEELFAAASARLAQVSIKDPQTVEREKESLAADILGLYTKTLINLRTTKPPFISEISEHPKASDVARFLAKNNFVVTNQLHELARTDVLGSNLIMLCDGKNSKDEIIDKLVELVKSGALNVAKDGVSVKEDAQIREVLKPVVESALTSMSKSAVLVG